jgi:predicted peptidase
MTVAHPSQLRQILFVCLCICAVSCGAAKNRDSAPAKSSASGQPVAWPPSRLDLAGPGVHEFSARLPDGRGVRYTLSVPKDYDAKRPVPLVVALHYAGRVEPFYGRGMIDGLVGPACAGLGAIIVAPDAQGDKSWTDERNEKIVIWLVQSVMKTWSIDPKKVLLTGYSMGGEGTWYIGGRHQDLFTAAIPIAGRPTGETVWKVPIYVIHSQNDELIPIAPAEAHVRELKEKGAVIEWKALSGLTHFQTDRYQDALRSAVAWVKEKWK